jgi:hypothetical protein
MPAKLRGALVVAGTLFGAWLAAGAPVHWG